jgi:hypothetical protein
MVCLSGLNLNRRISNSDLDLPSPKQQATPVLIPGATCCRLSSTCRGAAHRIPSVCRVAVHHLGSSSACWGASPTPIAGSRRAGTVVECAARWCTTDPGQRRLGEVLDLAGTPTLTSTPFSPSTWTQSTDGAARDEREVQVWALDGRSASPPYRTSRRRSRSRSLRRRNPPALTSS